MATPPRPSPAEVEAAIARITARHLRHDDPRRSALGSEPRDVLEHLRRSGVVVPRLAYDDIWDELVLSAHLYWEDLTRERTLLRRARHLGVSLSELGAHLGIGTRQGMQDYLDRLDARLEVGIPDNELNRAARRRGKARPEDQRWLDRNRGEIIGLFDRLLEQAARVLPLPGRPLETGAGAVEEELPEEDDAADWLEELRADRDAGVLTPASMGVLGLVLSELRVDHRVQDLAVSHGLHRVLRDAERVRSAYAARADLT